MKKADIIKSAIAPMILLVVSSTTNAASIADIKENARVKDRLNESSASHPSYQLENEPSISSYTPQFSIARTNGVSSDTLNAFEPPAPAPEPAPPTSKPGTGINPPIDACRPGEGGGYTNGGIWDGPIFKECY